MTMRTKTSARIKAISLLGTAAMALALPSHTLAEQTLSYGTYLPSTHVVVDEAIMPFGERIAADSGGDLKLEVFAGGSLGKATAAVDQVRDGVVDASMIVDL